MCARSPRRVALTLTLTLTLTVTLTLTQACARDRLGVLPAFWALASRHADHEGSRALLTRDVLNSRHADHEGSRASRQRGLGGRGGAGAGRRLDCTHWLPCSGAMMHLNRVLLAAVSSQAAHP